MVVASSMDAASYLFSHAKKQINTLTQSLDDLLKSNHSSNNDDGVDDQMQIID